MGNRDQNSGNQINSKTVTLTNISLHIFFLSFEFVKENIFCKNDRYSDRLLTFYLELECYCSNQNLAFRECSQVWLCFFFLISVDYNSNVI